jgi:quercetin dioxygenase-like cupin family protein
MITEDLAPGTGVPVHRHLAEDEIIFIHRGQGTATLGENQHTVTAGATVFVPREMWHGLQNTGSETLTMLAIYAPAGFEGYFREIGNKPGLAPRGARSEEEARKIDRRFRIEYR